MKCEWEMKYRCVECGFEIKTLFVQYSPGNIRLMKCIILIDLVLHKQKAYRHLLYYVLNQEMMNLEGLLWKSTMAYLLLDAYRSLLLQRNEEQQGSSLSFSLLVLSSQKVSMDVFVGNLIFFCILLLATRILLNKFVKVSRCRNLFGAIVVSSYFKIFFIAMMVWEFPSSLIFIIDLFVFSSNAMALKAHNAAGPKRDIVLEEDRQQTGFLAKNAEEYADAVLKVLRMPEGERLEMATAARRRANRFSEQIYQNL